MDSSEEGTDDGLGKPGKDAMPQGDGDIGDAASGAGGEGGADTERAGDEGGSAGESGAGSESGWVQLDLRPGEVRLLRALLANLRALILDGEDPSIARLHPTAYQDNPDQEAAWQLIARSNLDDARLESIDAAARSLDVGRANAMEMHCWLTTLNSLRLVLGTRLGIEHDDHEPAADGPDSELWDVYEWLGYTQDRFLRLLTG